MWRPKKKPHFFEKDEPNKDIKDWITVNGVHIPIKKGQNKDDVVKKFLDDKGDKEPKKDKPKTSNNIDKPTPTKLGKKVQDFEQKIIDITDEKNIDWDSKGETLVAGFSRNTNPNNVKGETEIRRVWDEQIKKHPELKQVKQDIDNYEKNLNDTIKNEFKTTKSVYRGTSPKELDSILTNGSVEPYQQNFISFTLSKEAGLGFGKNQSGVTIEYDKDSILNSGTADLKPVNYSAYTDVVGIGEDKDKPYPISFSDEMEVRSNYFKTDKSVVKSITLHSSKFSKDELAKLKNKYEKEFKINVNVEESVNISGQHSKPTIYKKKKFEFKECACEWKEVVKEARYRAFTHSSSFVGNVRYDQDLQEMTVILNGQEYQFCNVPERVYDGFEGANSKGAYFNREIKSLYNC